MIQLAALSSVVLLGFQNAPPASRPTSAPASADPAARVSRERLRAHVEYLASDALGGRGPGSGARAASAAASRPDPASLDGLRQAQLYVADAFRASGLEPKGGDGWFQPFTVTAPGGRSVEGRNVVGFRAGSDPRLRDEVVILSAHVDHLGTRGGRVFHGADDDASGVAAMLEAARVIADAGLKPRRSLLFVGFDREEAGLEGSQHFVEHPPIPLERIALFINCDMLGRELGDVIDGWLFALGAEHAPSLREVVKSAAAGETLKTGLMGTDLIGIRGDYGPFLAKKVPYLFFSTGEHGDYHQPTDTADRIVYPKLEAVTRVVLRTLLAAADAPDRPVFAEPAPDVEEVRVLADILQAVADQAKPGGKLKLSDEEATQLRVIQATVRSILRKGRVNESERDQLRLIVTTMMQQMRSW